MGAFNQWLENDVRDRHNEMGNTAGRVDALRNDLCRLGSFGAQTFLLPAMISYFYSGVMPQPMMPEQPQVPGTIIHLSNMIYKRCANWGHGRSNDYRTTLATAAIWCSSNSSTDTSTRDVIHTS